MSLGNVCHGPTGSLSDPSVLRRTFLMCVRHVCHINSVMIWLGQYRSFRSKSCMSTGVVCVHCDLRCRPSADAMSEMRTML